MDLVDHILNKSTSAIEKANATFFDNIPDDVLVESIHETSRNGDETFIPYHLYINKDNIKRIKPILRDLLTLSQKRRAEATQLIEFMLEEPGRVKLTLKKMCEACGINYASFQIFTREQPAVWKFINICLVQETDSEYEGRIHRSVADGALHGAHQDRRLYLELTGRLSRGSGLRSPGGVNIVFVQDALQRPGVQSRVIDVGAKRTGELDTSPMDPGEQSDPE